MESKKVIVFAEASDAVKAALATPLSCIDLSARARRVAKRYRALYAGDLAQLTPSAIHEEDNVGKTTVREIERLLSELGLGFGCRVTDWDRETVSSWWRDRQGPVPGGRTDKPAETLEEEMVRLVGCLRTENARLIVLSLMGWDGQPPKTLEMTARPFGLTRERVRQVRTRFDSVASAGVPLPVSKRAADLIREAGPIPVEQANRILIDNGLTKIGFDARGLALVDPYADGGLALTTATIEGVDYVGGRDAASNAQTIMKKAASYVSSRGIIDCSGVAAEMGEDGLEVAAREVSRLVAARSDCRFLDDDRLFATFVDGPRNRLANVVIKMLKAGGPLSVGTMLDGIERDIRIRDIAPTQSLLRAFCMVRADLFRVEGDLVHLTLDISLEKALGGINVVFHEILRNEADGLAIEDLQHRCLSRGMKPNSFLQFLTYSPILRRLDQGRRYALIGQGA